MCYRLNLIKKKILTDKLSGNLSENRKHCLCIIKIFIDRKWIKLLLTLARILKIKQRAQAALERYLVNKIAENNPRSLKVVQTLSYWLLDYVKMLGYEDATVPMVFKKYKRGDVIKANFGHRIGSEQGGLHYAIVIDVNNSQKSNVLTVIPLTSVKPNVDLNKLGNNRLYIGDEIYKAIIAKLNKIPNSDPSKKGLVKEYNRLKIGSIALVGQITTISKYRLYDPLSTSNVLHGIKVSDATLNNLDSKIKELFTKSN